MRALRNALISNLGLRKFSTFWKFQNSFLHLIFRYLNSASNFLPIDINFNVKIKCYDVSYFYPFYYFLAKFKCIHDNFFKSKHLKWSQLYTETIITSKVTPWESNLHAYYRDLIAWLYWYKYAFSDFYHVIWYFKCIQGLNINALMYLSTCILRKYID